MAFRINLALAGALVALAGPAYASPTSNSTITQARMEAITARMASGASYDQATRDTRAPTDDGRVAVADAPTSTGQPYVQVVGAARWSSENTEVVNARWTKHLWAMTLTSTHEAGWAASANE